MQHDEVGRTWLEREIMRVREWDERGIKQESDDDIFMGTPDDKDESDSDDSIEDAHHEECRQVRMEVDIMEVYSPERVCKVAN